MSAARRIRALAGAETLLLRRNPMALLTGAFTPVALTLAVRAAPASGQPTVSGASLATGLAGFALLALVYYNLVTILVARREELMLKRLRTGEATDAEILAGAAVPSVVLAWGQIAVAVGVFALRWPGNIAILLLGTVLGTLVFGLLAALSTTLTRTVEMAQVTTLPVLAVSCIFAVPGALGGLPPFVTDIGQWLPMSRVVELVHQGLNGSGRLSDAVAPTLVLAAWAVAAGWATRRWFRWEPRR